MREILFRGKMERGVWVYGGIAFQEGGDVAIVHTLDYYKSLYDLGIDADYVIPETVGQFTGHLIEGKKVFEGDIVKCRHCWRYGRSIYDDTVEEFLAQKIRGAYGKYVEDGYCGKNCYYYRNYVVEYDRLNGCWRLKNGSVVHCIGKSTLFNRNAEILGNIHDNPELMKGGAE